jgi:hypothetical protein
MILSVPLLMIAAALVFHAYRYQGLRAWHAMVCVLLGFLLAASGAAPDINSLINGLAHWLTPGGKGSGR